MELKDLRLALIQSNPKLSKFNPLSRILFYDDFDEGINGWTELIGNHDGNLDNVRKVMEDLRPPQLSNCNFFDVGTHGSMEGTYSLKLATRAKAKHMSQAIKRLTSVKRGKVQFETYLTYKSEQIFQRKENNDEKSWDGNFDPSESDFGDFTISNDICEGNDGIRYHCALRYVNADENGKLINKWMYKTSVHPSTKMVRSGMVSPNEDFHVIHPSDWKEVPGEYQTLCYNEVPTKVNWHYLKWTFDTTLRRNVELQLNDRIYDLRNIEVPVYEHKYESLNNLLNFCIDVRTLKDVRNFLYLDSVLVSVDW
jgi:hypothetical protein